MKSGILNLTSYIRDTTYDIRNITYEIIKEICKTNPICRNTQMNVSSAVTKNYNNEQ